MILTSFDPDKGHLFTGEFMSVEVIDPAIPGHVPNLVLDRSKQFNIDIEWKLTGSDVLLYLTALAPSNWVVSAYAESVGPGPEIIIGEGIKDRTDFTTDAVGARLWTTTLTIPPNTLQEEDPGPGGPSGTYKIEVTVFLNSTLGSPGYDIIGFAEGPVIKVESPV